VTTPRLDALVRDRLGLDPESLGESAFRGAVRHRMTARRVTTPEAYAGLLATDPAEWAALAAELVVPETWFFRGGRPLFDHLAGWVAARGSRPVRILSLPCSTGEEPFSLALALRERGVSPAGYQLDAVDLAAGHLARAAAGRFAASSFREPDPDPRPRHFRPTDDGRWELDAEIRGAVRFRPGNAVEPGLLAGESPYDLIVCRNLFIYLTPEARERVAAHFERLLAPDGLLCVSPTEAARLPRARFVADGPPAFCLLRRASGVGRVEALRGPTPRPQPRRASTYKNRRPAILGRGPSPSLPDPATVANKYREPPLRRPIPSPPPGRWPTPAGSTRRSRPTRTRPGGTPRPTGSACSGRSSWPAAGRTRRPARSATPSTSTRTTRGRCRT